MDLKVTYIAHSGFLAETDTAYLLFDYFEGQIPAMQKEKPLFVFASHRHADHFNPAIFELAEVHPDTTYILGYDIKLTPWKVSKWKLSDEVKERIVSVKAEETYHIEGLQVTTLKSTDEGVAFLVQSGDAVIYHAGDLNWWYWEEESKQWNNNMSADFKREADKLTNVSIDVAFLPLDPRLEEAYWMGFIYMLGKAEIKTAFPMHMWKDYSIIDRLHTDGYAEEYGTNVINIKGEGQTWIINI